MAHRRERLALHSSSSLLLLLVLLWLGNCSAVQIERSPCNGSIAECDPEDLEMAMESEVSRRFLAGGGPTIGYGSLDKDRPVFGGGNGQPYSKSLPANPYTRDCEKIYKCRK